MEKSLLLRKSIFTILMMALLAPILVLVLKTPWEIARWDPFLLKVLSGALVQATLSTVFTLLLGFLGCIGLFYLSYKLAPSLFSVFCFLIVIPSFLPPITVVVLGAKASGQVLTGLGGVVYFHLIMNVGLMSFLFFESIEAQAKLWLRDSFVMGVSRSKFVVRGLVPEIKKDFLSFSFYFFLLYFFSFSVPFLVGGSQYGGVEVFIYEKILFFGQWSEALQYTLVLFLVFVILSKFINRPASHSWQSFKEPQPYLGFFGHWFFTFIPIAPFALLAFGLAQSAFLLRELQFDKLILEMRMTLLLGLCVSLFCFIFLSLLTFCYVGRSLSRLLLAWVHPGWVVVGFSFLLLSGDNPIQRILFLVLALGLLYIPFLVRMSFQRSLEELAKQALVCDIMPVPWYRVFFKVLWPQMLPTISLLSGLAGVWACGDFALSEILLDPSQSSSLALEMKQLLSNYRLEQALALLWPLLFCCGLVFFIFQGLVYVSGKKSLS